MKLYTEEMFLIASEKCGLDCNMAEHIMQHIDIYVTPIELPSDEEIYDKAVFHDGSDYSLGEHNGFIEGAKWMRDKIKGGNK